MSLTPYALTRIAIGGAATLAPTTAAKAWLGPVAADLDVRTVVRTFGVRDALLGVAVLAFDGHPTAIKLCMAADATDAVACLGQAARTRRPGAFAAAGAALTGVVMGALALRRSPAR